MRYSLNQMNKKTVDLNCDLGESYGNDSLSLDHEIMPYISSCNIACGFHSGDPHTIKKTIDLAVANGVEIGAHPSYPDLQGFGRRYMEIEINELKSIIQYQISAIKGIATISHARLHHVKPHGALYNTAARNEEIASMIVDAVLEIDDELILYGLSGSIISQVAKSKSLRFSHEVFADRLYEDDLRLSSRSQEGAVLKHEAVMNQVRHFIEDESVVTLSGKSKQIEIDTICLHSDTPDAIQLSKDIYELITNKQIEITSTL